MPVIGFGIKQQSICIYIAEHDFHVIEYTHDLLAFAINSPRDAFSNDSVSRRKPGALHHLAFKANSREEVDKAYRELARIVVNIPFIKTVKYSNNYDF